MDEIEQDIIEATYKEQAGKEYAKTDKDDKQLILTPKHKEIRVNKCMPCPIVLGKVILDGNLFRRSFFHMEKKKSTAGEKTALLAPVTKFLQHHCPLQFNDLKASKTRIAIRVYCDFKSCKSYRLNISFADHIEGEVEATVYGSTNDEDHVTGGYRGGKRNLAGEVRRQRTADALKSFPRELMNEDRFKADPELVVSNNMDGACTDAVYKKIRNEALKADDLDDDPMLALYQLGQKLERADPMSNYIASVRLHPPMAIFVSEAQVQAMLRLSLSPLRKKQPLIAGMDSTGKIGGKVRTIDGKVGKTYFYRVVVQVVAKNRGENEVLALLEAMVMHEDTVTVKSFLEFFVQRCTLTAQRTKTSMPNSLFDIIVVDKALSSLFGISLTFNHAPLHMVYNFIYRAIFLESVAKVKEARAIMERLVVPMLCYCHNSKNVTQKIQKTYPWLVKGTAPFKFLKRVYRLIASSTNFAHLLFDIYRNVAILLNRRFVDKHTMAAFNKLTALIATSKRYEASTGYLPTFQPETVCSLPYIDTEPLNMPSNDRFYEKTAFYWCFKGVEDQVVAIPEDDQATEKNIFFSTEFARYLRIHHIPHIAAVSQITHPLKFSDRPDIKPQRRNNQFSEAGFAELKQKLRADKNRRLGGKINRNIVTLRPLTEATLKFTDFGDEYIPTRQKRSQPHTNSVKKRETEAQSTPVRLKRKRSQPFTPKTPAKRSRVEKAEEEVRIYDTPIIMSTWDRADPTTKDCGFVVIANNVKSADSPLSKSLTLTLPINDNGVVTDPTYYQRTLQSVERYQPFVVKHGVVSGVDICDFRDKNVMLWADPLFLVIDVMADSYEDFSVLMPNTGASIFDLLQPDHLQRLVSSNSSYRLPECSFLLMPVTNAAHAHHYLCFANFKTLQFTCVDSLYESGAADSTLEEQRIVSRFEKFIIWLLFNGKGTDGWTPVLMSHMRQPPGSLDCGLYVIRHSEQLMQQHRTTAEDFDATVYRSQCLEILFEAANDMKGSCFVCIGPKDNTALTCIFCHRFTHRRCMREEYVPNLEGVCELCELRAAEYSLRAN